MGLVARAMEIILKLLTRFEGFRSRPYLCPAGVWTIGKGSTTYLSGTPVKPGDPPISEETADRLASKQVLDTYMPATQSLCPKLTEAELLAAITDFSYNYGVTRLKASTLRKRVNAVDWEGAMAELRKWIYAGGKRMPGLVLRNEARCDLIKRALSKG